MSSLPKQVSTHYPFMIERRYPFSLELNYMLHGALINPTELEWLRDRAANELRPEDLQKPYSLQDPCAVRPHLTAYVHSLKERFLKAGELLFPAQPCWETLMDLVNDAAIALGYKRMDAHSYWKAIRFVERRWGKKLGLSDLLDGVVHKMTLLPRHPLSLIAYEIRERLPLPKRHRSGPFPEPCASWDYRDGVISFRLSPALRNSQDAGVARLVHIFDLVGSNAYPPQLTAELWSEYYELIRPLIPKQLNALINALKIKSFQREQLDAVRAQMKSILGFCAVMDLQREEQLWEHRFPGHGWSETAPDLVQCIFCSGSALCRLVPEDYELRLRKVIYPWRFSPTELAVERKRSLVRARQARHRAGVKGTTGQSP
jgi:hypothetical protein